MDTKRCVEIFLLCILMAAVASVESEEITSDLMLDIEKAESEDKVLSRRKRFLIFPDGSSFQLVFCTQNHGYLQIGDVVWFGTTAALAWELPTDPNLFNFLKKHEKNYDSLRRHDSKHLIFLNENGKVVSTMPYRRKPIVNPAFAKRSVDDQQVNKKDISVKEMHEAQKNSSYFNDLDDKSIEFHRRGREGLYDKLETFFEGLGWRGKDCVLRMLCESAKTREKQGSFLDEILRATFTLPRSRGSSNLLEYDVDHKNGDCEQLYSKCENVQERSL